jgi:hypothetical protein
LESFASLSRAGAVTKLIVRHMTQAEICSVATYLEAN